MEIKERATRAEQRAAHAAVARALRAGQLVKPTACAWCGGAGRLHGHHPDYNRLLMVVWVCATCHGKHTSQHHREWRLFDHVR